MTGPPPRVLFLGHAAERTGPPLILLELLRWLRSETDIETGVVLKEGGELLEEYRTVTPVWVAPDWLGPGASDLAARGLAKAGAEGLATRLVATRLRRPLREIGRWPVVYANCAGSVSLLPQLPHPPERLVVHVHELSVGLDYHLPAGAADRIRRADEIIAVSGAVVDEVLARGLAAPDRITTVPGCIEAPRSTGPAPSRRDLGIPDDAFVIGSSGLLHWRKAPDLFVSLATRMLRGRQDDPWFVWVGGEPDGPAGLDVRADLERAGIADRVRLVPHQADPVSWFRLLDVFCLPAREDAFPLVCLEAASVRLPVVCFTSGGMPEFVDGDAGVVVDYPDLDAMARALDDLRADGPRRTGLGRTGAARVAAHHTVPTVAAQLAAVVRANVEALG